MGFRAVKCLSVSGRSYRQVFLDASLSVVFQTIKAFAETRGSSRISKPNTIEKLTARCLLQQRRSTRYEQSLGYRRQSREGGYQTAQRKGSFACEKNYAFWQDQSLASSLKVCKLLPVRFCYLSRTFYRQLFLVVSRIERHKSVSGNGRRQGWLPQPSRSRSWPIRCRPLRWKKQRLEAQNRVLQHTVKLSTRHIQDTIAEKVGFSSFPRAHNPFSAKIILLKVRTHLLIFRCCPWLISEVPPTF